MQNGSPKTVFGYKVLPVSKKPTFQFLGLTFLPLITVNRNAEGALLDR